MQATVRNLGARLKVRDPEQSLVVGLFVNDSTVGRKQEDVAEDYLLGHFL